MPSLDELVPVAEAAAYIFTGSVVRTHASTESTVIIKVEDVMKAPPGLRGLAGMEVTVQLLHPLAPGQYVFFADPIAIGDSIAVKELAHLEGRAKGQAEGAIERGYSALISRRAEQAFIVALGRIGPVTPLLTPAERRNRVPWAAAPFEIERLLKGSKKTRRLTLLGPVPGTKRLPRTPALRPDLSAILFLQRPPGEALEFLSEEDRHTAAHIADTSDIQSPDRVETITQILKGAERE
jgi:hypothetical protein